MWLRKLVCLSEREWKFVAFQFGADYVQAIVNKADTVLQARDDHTLNAGKRRGTPLRSVDAAVVACRRQAANVTFAAVVIRRHSRVIKEGEQLVAVFEQPLPNTHTVGILTAAAQDEIVEAVVNLLACFSKGFLTSLLHLTW
jgi:hypothetical protein